MAFRARDISSVDDPIRARQQMQSIATELAAANSNAPQLRFSGGDPLRVRQAAQKLLEAGKDAAVQNSADQDDEPVNVVSGSDGRGRLQRLQRDFQDDVL